jgi:membrane protease YdiL (CAAX protease family)
MLVPPQRHLPRSVHIPGIGTFLVVALAFSAAFYAPILVTGRLFSGAGLYVIGLMWSPAVAALFTCRIHRIDIATLGWHWGGAKYQAFAYLLPAGYALVAYAFIWMTPLGALRSPLPASAATMLSLVLSAFVGLIAALGEEIGWRGFLAPRLAAKWGFTRASVIVGCIWAAWHYPALLFADYNLGTPWWYALSCFTAMVIAVSVIFTWFQLTTGSLWVATFLHGSHNLFVKEIFTPLTEGTEWTRFAIDEFGFALPVVTTATAMSFWARRDVAVAALRARHAGLWVRAAAARDQLGNSPVGS